MSQKRVYFFGNGKAEGNAKMKELLGGKGANLAEMTKLGIPARRSSATTIYDNKALLCICQGNYRTFCCLSMRILGFWRIRSVMVS